MLEFVLAGLLIWGAATGSLGDVFPQPDIPGPKAFLFSESQRQIRTQHVIHPSLKPMHKRDITYGGN